MQVVAPLREIPVSWVSERSSPPTRLKLRNHAVPTGRIPF